MNIPYLAAGLLLIAVVTFTAGYVHSLRGEIAAQRASLAEQGEYIGTLEAAAAVNLQTIAHLWAGRAADARVMAERDTRIEGLQAENRGLERQKQEALRGKTNLFTLDSLLPAAFADGLCLQYRAAAGAGSGNAAGDAAGSLDARAGDTAAACAVWQTLTFADVLDWVGPLLEHAGLERADKAALRGWAEGRVQ